MKLFFFLLWILPFSLCADDPFSGDEDLALFHHVNVISGHLSLSFQDTVVEGALPLPIVRTYSSSGALERDYERDIDLLLKNKRLGRLFHGGWNLMPHTNLFIQGAYKKKYLKVHLPDRGGMLITYVYSHKGENESIFLKPQIERTPSCGTLSARNNPKNHLLRLKLKKAKATLYHADGSILIYRGKELPKEPRDFCYYSLDEEILPSKHCIKYSVEDQECPKKIKMMNPAKDKLYSWVRFHQKRTKTPSHFQIRTSDNKFLDYQFTEFKERDYLNKVEGNCRPLEQASYCPGRKGTGARIGHLSLGAQTQFKVSYYLPCDKKCAEKWAERPEKKDLVIDRVQKLEAPCGPNGELRALAQFFYSPGVTDVRDASHLLTRYHHDGHRLLKIEYFDEGDQLKSVLQFIYEGDNLRAKVFLNEKQEALFSKTFSYDAYGNVTEEKVWGNLSGNCMGPFSMQADGALAGAESYYKRYVYSARFHMPLVEEEEGGLTYRYAYLPDTNLLQAKFTCDKERILLRQFFIYDPDHFLIEDVEDDGQSADLQDLSGVTERHIKRYKRHPDLALVTSMSQWYWESGRERLLKRIDYGYGINYRVRSEAVFDAEERHRYTLFTDYDAHGNITRKTSPSGRENHYQYDAYGNLLSCKEVGAPKKNYTYNPAGLPLTYQEIGFDGKTKTTRSIYDPKGRLIGHTDARGNMSAQTYDAFGNCRASQFPPARDEEGQLFDPVVSFTYDLQGNLTTHTTPKGATTRTDYNCYRSPIRLIQADQTELLHHYHKTNTLADTLYPDQTKAYYAYDAFKRMTAKSVYAAEGQLLSREEWVYNTYHLLSYTDARGLTTTYTYDGAGRLIGEEAGGRSKNYHYDALGFLEKTSEGDLCKIQIHNEEGEVIEEWIDNNGLIENQMRFSYNPEGKKEKALRVTAQGEAIDTFEYDSEGHLIRHTDPYGGISQFLYTEIENSSHQKVLQKTQIDPLKQIQIDTFDAAGRLVVTEKQDPQGNRLALEEFFYDRDGNKARQRSTIFLATTPLKTIQTRWEHDSMGRILRQIEAEEKITQFKYDCRGRVSEKILPNQVHLHFTYDGIDRLLHIQSSDQTIDTHYLYKGPDPVFIEDLAQRILINRSYNLFGQLLEEINHLCMSYRWDYDSLGRCIQFTLPDQSSIQYTYSGSHLTQLARYNQDDGLLYAHQYTRFDPCGHVVEEERIHHLGTITRTRDLMERPIATSCAQLQQTLTYNPCNLVTKATSSLFGSKNYAYDSLQQLIQEDTTHYSFDSLGNPAHAKTNDQNQILALDTIELRYDPNGNPQERVDETQQVLYEYDALGRLTHLILPKKKKIRYFYDPFSRLFAKASYLYIEGQWQRENKIHYLYDQELEIGTITSEGQIEELKVLGLGIKGDLAAAVAIELRASAYAPLHDLSGNIIALINQEGLLVESYEQSAFGKETLVGEPINPWRFQSKRSDEGLIFFGLRFYDPSLGRWLTPDPSGFTDGPNLYLFLLNSPLNRLDLFGLYAEIKSPLEPYSNGSVFIDIPIHKIRSIPGDYSRSIRCKGYIQDVQVDWIVSCGHWHKLQFSQEELTAGKVNILNHFNELMPKEGSFVGLITNQNGITTSKRDFCDSFSAMVSKVPEGTLCIGLYNPTKGVPGDLKRTFEEMNGNDTKSVATTRQFIHAIADSIHKINPKLLWLHIPHSEAGLISYRSIEKLPDKEKKILNNQLYLYPIASAKPIPNDFAFKVDNVYSEKDHITKRFANKYLNDPNYTIRIVECISSWSERSLYIADHAFLGKTYQTDLKKKIGELRSNYGFYHENTR